MLPDAAVLELFVRACGGAAIAVIEGVMGLFDGKTGQDEAGSTSRLAKLLRAPVILVVDASAVARSAAALVHGFNTFDPELRLAGVIVNRVAGEGHYRIVADAIEHQAGVPVLGYLSRDSKLELPERYLGLIPTPEHPISLDYFGELCAACERTIDVERVEQIAASAPPLPEVGTGTGLFPAESTATGVRIAVARDAAFSFYYEDNLDLLRSWGAEVVEFSPLLDQMLPPKTSAIYLGGGFPELYADRLAENGPMLQSIRLAAESGMPLYAECGGLMYAGEALTDADGRRHAMLGLVPAESNMRNIRLSLGYREVRALSSSMVLPKDAVTRAHEFHYSTLESPPPAETAAYKVDGSERVDGYRCGSVLASYIHLHFGSSRDIAPRFVAAASHWSGKKGSDQR
jgi:cobyrinic acid a,c-diamide synthase